jgi:hypothetical protein|tara:strand:+ start:1161 stop:1478 length:318 start_codon:yes stop_codon:yes gene_type:complete
MIKESVILTPHTDKAYDSVDAFYTENDYASYRDHFKSFLIDKGVDVTDEAVYMAGLVDGDSKVKITVGFADEAQQTECNGDDYHSMLEMEHTMPVSEDTSADHLF